MPSQRFKGFTVLRVWRVLKGLEGVWRVLGVLAKGGAGWTWTPRVWRVLREAIDVWPWGAF